MLTAIWHTRTWVWINGLIQMKITAPMKLIMLNRHQVTAIHFLVSKRITLKERKNVTNKLDYLIFLSYSYIHKLKTSYRKRWQDKHSRYANTKCEINPEEDCHENTASALLKLLPTVIKHIPKVKCKHWHRQEKFENSNYSGTNPSRNLFRGRGHCKFCL